jgi:hypothetical protein
VVRALVVAPRVLAALHLFLPVLAPVVPVLNLVVAAVLVVVRGDGTLGRRFFHLLLLVVLFFFFNCNSSSSSSATTITIQLVFSWLIMNTELITLLKEGNEGLFCVAGTASEPASLWKEKSARLSCCDAAIMPAACFQSNCCAGMAPVVGDARMLDAELNSNGESSSSAGLSPAGMAK